MPMQSPNFIPPARRGLMTIGQPPPSAPGGAGQFDMPPAEEAMTEGDQGAPSPFAGGTYTPQAASSALNAAFAARPAGDPDQSAFATGRALNIQASQDRGDVARQSVSQMFPYPGQAANIADRQALVTKANPQWAFDAATADQNRRFADPGQVAQRDVASADLLRNIHEQYAVPEQLRAQNNLDVAGVKANAGEREARIKAEAAAKTANDKADAAQKIAAHMAEVIISRGTPDQATGKLRPLNDQERAQVYRETNVTNPAAAPGVPGDNVLTQQYIDQYLAAHPGSTQQQAIEAAKLLGFTIR